MVLTHQAALIELTLKKTDHMLCIQDITTLNMNRLQRLQLKNVTLMVGWMKSHQSHQF